MGGASADVSPRPPLHDVQVIDGIPIQEEQTGSVRLDDISFSDLSFNPPSLGQGKEVATFLLFILSFFAPGWGTFAVSVLQKSWKVLVISILQMILAGNLIGWCWAIYWCMAVWIKTKKESDQARQQRQYLEQPSGGDSALPTAQMV
ncbi:unnamed protein product [Heterosigma akashiwo]